MTALTADTIWQALDEVKDPEIPVVSVVEMGIVREVSIDDNSVRVTITPTFAGCPALAVMQDDIAARIRALGVAQVEVAITLHPAWTTEWISAAAREKLRSFGLAPPPRHGGDFELTLLDVVKCPYCGSSNTSLKNSFGPTACRMIYYCHGCQQPFEQFKPL